MSDPQVQDEEAPPVTTDTSSSLREPLLIEEESSSPTTIEASSSSTLPADETTRLLYPSLHRASSSFHKWLLPICILCTHGLFLYGQTAPMWFLAYDLEIDAWANASSYEASWACTAIGMNKKLHLEVNQSKTVKTFTYAYAIEELWAAKGLPGKVLPRLAAALLAIFSGGWPHLKLFLLLMTWWFARQPIRRKRMLSALSTLGKWSLVDVLVVSLLVGVLDLRWIVVPTHIQHAVLDHLKTLLHLTSTIYSPEEVCGDALGYKCHDPHKLIHKINCKACMDAVYNIYKHPSLAKSVLKGFDVSGDGLGTLQVIGMRGIYAFCAAVVCSILLSLWVDVLNQRHSSAVVESSTRTRAEATRTERLTRLLHMLPTVPRRRAHNEDHENDLMDSLLSDTFDGPESSLVLHGNNDAANASTEMVNGSQLPQVLEVDSGGSDPENERSVERNGLSPSTPATAAVDFDDSYSPMPRRRRQCRWFSCCPPILRYICSAVGCWSLLGLVITAVFAPTMQRQVHGAIPQLLHDILGVEWTQSYSLVSLTETTGKHGGWDWMLMGTVGLFLVAGPVLRAVLCAVASLVKSKSVATRRLYMWIDAVGAFCAWEVFWAALFMVDLLMPSITSTILEDHRCAEISDSNKCLTVEFDMLRNFLLIVIGGAALLVVSNLAVWKNIS